MAMTDERTYQISFDLGTRGDARPDFATVKIGGDLLVTHDIAVGEEVTVTVTDRHGEVIAEGKAVCDWPRFKTTIDKHDIATTERIHPVKING